MVNQNESSPLVPFPVRMIILVTGILSLIFGIWSGLWRAGWNLPLSQTTLPSLHGPLMISGFLGTVISLERAVALKKLWAFLSPFVTGIGAVLLIFTDAVIIAKLLILIGSLVLSGVFFRLYFKDSELHYGVMGLGANLWFIGNLLWLRNFPMPQIVYWWAGFLILTIAGERLELNRVLSLSLWVRNFFLGILIANILALFLMFFTANISVRLYGVSLVLLTFWLFRYDLARRSLKLPGLSRFMALALLSGYVWLGFSGFILMGTGGDTSGLIYDATLHSIFVGFVFSMIFGHAPIIFPVVLRLKVAYRTSYYFHLVLLHISLIVRIAGDLSGNSTIRYWGSLINALAILLFLYNTVTSILDKKYDSASSSG